jgi:hypothetical protein
MQLLAKHLPCLLANQNVSAQPSHLPETNPNTANSLTSSQAEILQTPSSQ